MAFKRKIGAGGLQRRVRPRREDDWEMDHDGSQASSSDDDEVEEQGTRRGDYEEDEDDDENEEDGSEPQTGSDQESDDEEEEVAAPNVDFSSISFGALAKAQSSLPPAKRKSKSAASTAGADSSNDHDRTPAGARKPSKRPSKDDPKPKRTSKHAPQEQTSKKPVSRRRETIPDNRRQFRDPRFDPLVGRLDEEKAQKNYAFLDEYRDKEMADLRVQIKKTKNEEAKETLKRQLLSMQSKKKARVRKEEADNLLREHRQREKGLVAQGKTPYYLKKSEQKKMVLMDRFADMSKGQVDRAIERKRKKVAGKEKKELGSLQRRSRG